MIAKRIIPCLDVNKGRVVKGINFVNLKDAGDPVNQAIVYNKEGADELVFLDITASYEKRDIIIDVVKRTVENIFIPVTVGGGIRNIQTIRKLLKAGADKVSLNSAAVKNPNIVKEASNTFGRQCIVVAIDVKRSKIGFEVYINGGRNATGINAIEWAKKMENSGAGEILLTSMDKDGTQNGYDLELTKAVSDAVNIPIIASGGAGSLEHLRDVLNVGADAALAASIFHFGIYSIKQTKEYLKGVNINVRL